VGKTHFEIDAALRAFVERQKMFFVATAPSGDSGHINCSPKGLDTLRVLGPSAIAYIDYTGSGVETIAHLRENGRIVVMLCAFDGAPRIVRFYGHGRVVEPADDGFAALAARFDPGPGVRAVIYVDVEKAIDSCGFGVPLMSFGGERTQLAAWAERKGAEGLVAYRREKNAVSLDGLPGLRSPGNAGA
jgi:hypothetical protein